jgi:hypothetical protein
MKQKFTGNLNVHIHTLDSIEAKPYAFAFKGSTNVLLDDEWVPLGIALDKAQMGAFLAEKLSPASRNGI